MFYDLAPQNSHLFGNTFQKFKQLHNYSPLFKGLDVKNNNEAANNTVIGAVEGISDTVSNSVEIRMVSIVKKLYVTPCINSNDLAKEFGVEAVTIR